MQVCASLRPSVARVVAFANDGKTQTSKSAKVKFTVEKRLEFGRNFAVVGSTPLSTWDPSSPSALELEWHSGDCWEGEAVVPAGSPLEFKLVIRDEHGVEWQSGPNMTITVPEDAAEVAVQAAWEDPTKILVKSTAMPVAPVAAATATAATSTPIAMPSKAAPVPQKTPAAATSAAPHSASRLANASPSIEMSALASAGKLEHLKVAELKALASKCGVATSGKKADIIKRLRAMQME